jgi:spore germination protein KC
MAKTGTKPLLEFLTREPNFHLKANVFIVQGEASKLKKAAIVFERVPSEIFREFAKQGFIVNATLKDLLVARYYGNDTIIGMLVSGEKEKVSEKNKKEIWFGTGGAVLIRDGKLAAKLNVKEMRGALWILNELKGAIITIDSPSDGGKISFLAELKSTKIVPKTSKDKIVFHITCLARDEIVSIDSNLKATDPHQYEVLTRALSGEVEERMKRVLNKSKEIGADSFGLGRYLEWNYPKEWKRIKDHWDTVYKEQVEFDVHAIIEVKHKGSIGKSPWTRWAG